MLEFVLNNTKTTTDVPDGMLLVDFIREEQKLKGTKSACREGDCGSCTVIEGRLNGKVIHYKTVASCITPMINVHKTHIVTIESFSRNEISPIQKALIDSAAIQCGYCTPGFVLAITAYALSSNKFSIEAIKDAVGGNICRCTGYKSIERALYQIISGLNKLKSKDKLAELIDKKYIPAYFRDIPKLLVTIKKPVKNDNAKLIVGGGTDLFVQKPDIIYNADIISFQGNKNLESIKKSSNGYKLGAACKISDLSDSDLVERMPNLPKYLSLIGSKMIRNMATVGGNIVNASPIGDLSIIFLTLGAKLNIVSDKKVKRNIKLRDFFKAYKVVDLKLNEYIESIDLAFSEKEFLFNFEKVSKRKYLDIATVNSAIKVEMDGTKIRQIDISMGGVAPIPLYLAKTSNFLSGKIVEIAVIKKASEILVSEISPIDDIRGSATYKKLLAKQLFFAHFIELFPKQIEINQLLPKQKSLNQVSEDHAKY